MTLIKSISGFRGTIGGKPGDTLNPLDIVKSVSAYGTLRRNIKGYAHKLWWVAMPVFPAKWFLT